MNKTLFQRFVFPLALAAMMLAAQDARAYETPITDAAQKTKLEELAKAHQHYADDFGFKTFAWGGVSKDGGTYTLKYLPEGVTADKWKNMMVMTIYPLSGNKTADAKAMTGTITMLEKQYPRFAAILTDEKYTSTEEEPMLFFEFMMGRGDQEVYHSCAFMRTGPATAAFIQYENKAAPVPQDTSVKMKELVFLQAK